MLMDGGKRILYGRVRNQEGAGVPGALVMIFHSDGEGESLLGHGYCDREGWYVVELDGFALKNAGRYIIRASASNESNIQRDSGISWMGWTTRFTRQKYFVESRVINYSLLSFTASDGKRMVVLEVIPETINLHCVENHFSKSRTITITGRGHIHSDRERGEGTFLLTVTRFHDQAAGELLRFVVSPDILSADGLEFDTGGMYAGLE